MTSKHIHFAVAKRQSTLHYDLTVTQVCVAGGNVLLLLLLMVVVHGNVIQSSITDFN